MGVFLEYWSYQVLLLKHFSVIINVEVDSVVLCLMAPPPRPQSHVTCCQSETLGALVSDDSTTLQHPEARA